MGGFGDPAAIQYICWILAGPSDGPEVYEVHRRSPSPYKVFRYTMFHGLHPEIDKCMACRMKAVRTRSMHTMHGHMRRWSRSTDPLARSPTSKSHARGPAHTHRRLQAASGHLGLRHLYRRRGLIHCESCVWVYDQRILRKCLMRVREYDVVYASSCACAARNKLSCMRRCWWAGFEVGLSLSGLWLGCGAISVMFLIMRWVRRHCCGMLATDEQQRG